MATSPGASAHDPYAVLRLPSFRWLIVSILTLTMGTQLQAVVIGWRIYEATRDPLALGLVGLAEVVPYIGVALVAGHVVDHADRRRISWVAVAVLLASAAALLAFSARGTDTRRIWPYYAILAVCGVARAFAFSARPALVSEVVPRDLLANATRWRSSTWQLGNVLGPAIGGLAYAAIGATATLAVNVALHGVALAGLLAVRHVPTPVPSRREPVLAALGAGVRFLRAQHVILAALTLDMLAVFFGGAVALMPIFAGEILHVGARGAGILQAAPGVGAVAMALVLAHRRPFEHAGRTLLVAVAVFGACMIGFAVSTSFALSVALLVLSGAADNVSAIIRSTLIQVLVPPSMLGRIASVNALFVGSSNELGSFESGVAARLMGTVLSVVAGGAMTLAVVAGTAWRVPALRRLRRIEAP